MVIWSSEGRYYERHVGWKIIWWLNNPKNDLKWRNAFPIWAYFGGHLDGCLDEHLDERLDGNLDGYLDEHLDEQLTIYTQSGADTWTWALKPAKYG